ncbi:ABC transporter substrate-binding protein [Anaerocolumna sp. AGMB13025]|uniref:ABC transporter substrate-binding protein n=1 Tax=Anaerocolumna sp. AGMB13025 TaxID=3039116 RepID=UPI00241FDB91|nr:ABC transporter substrate-binding protein [Anaerocolumna sp. AGMB13025]WFR59385.1 ABC transporter substrate-binding protein [Anaerocolumna sp. AGMB13025]
MRKMKKITALFLAMLFVMTTVLAGCGKSNTKDTTTDTASTDTTEATVEPTATETPTPEATAEPTSSEPADPNQLPRNETLYYGGQQWGAVNGWNPLSDDMNNALVLAQAAGGSRTLMYETLYMYNMLDGSMTPLLADGDYSWNDAKTEMTVKIKGAAKWSDGTPVTADDVAYTFDSNVKYQTAQGVGLAPYIESVTAVDPSTVLIKAKLTDDGKPVNPLMLISYLGQTYVIQKAWIQTLEARCDSDAAKVKKDPADDVVYSGPYHKYYADDQKVILIRDDNYWGKDASMWGSLPAPKYIAHTIYADNAATETAFKKGEVDVDQQFIPNIQDLWLKDGLPISTYLQDAPYGVCVNMPTAWFNFDVPGLDNVAVRKAIAMAVDYDAIIANAVTGQSPSFKDVPRSVMNPTAGEQATFDHDAVKDLQWVGNDIEGAKKLLDDAGIKDTNGDGIREIKGKNLSFNACAPNGWTDWMAAMEIVAAAGKNIGIDITTEYPEWSVYQTVVTAAKQTDYDIFMMWTDSATPVQPWGRIRMLMSSEYNGIEGNWSGNWGHYSNKKIDELIKKIPTESDAAKLKSYYTEAVKIYLTDVPSFSLMYRPDKFHAVNESVWTNYPENGDGNNIPPMDLSDGYGIAGLYKITLVQ